MMVPGKGKEGNMGMITNRNTGKQVYRKMVLDLIERKAQRIQEKNYPQMILNIHGLVGIGKTCLMQQIYDHFEAQGYAVFLLNFDSEDHKEQSENIHSWEDCLSVLREHPTLRRLPDSIVAANDRVINVAEERIIYQVVDQFQQKVAGDKPMLLLLDSLDDLPYWKWIQAHIIKPLLDKQQTLVVATSQSPLFWHFWELREQCRIEPLDAFSREETEEYLQALGKQEMTDSIYQITNGYPLELDQIVRSIPGNGSSHPKPLSESEVKTCHHEVLERLKKRLPSKIQDELEEYLQTIIDIGSDFDLSSLRNEINARRAEKLAPGRINTTITSLNSRGFFHYNQERHRYTLNSIIKNLMNPHPPSV